MFFRVARRTGEALGKAFRIVSMISRAAQTLVVWTVSAFLVPFNFFSTVVPYVWDLALAR
jgi:hypothetical protein